MSSIEGHIRSFGMSGMLVCDELKAIENRFAVHLGHAPVLNAEAPEEYYPQFEQSVRQEANEMAKHYELFYCLEKSIRKLIAETLQESSGADWWQSGVVPEDIVQEVEKNINRERDSGVTPRSDAPIDYTTFGELSKIIIGNWSRFEPTLTSRRAVEKVMASLNTLRGPIAHCCPLAEDEIIRLNLAVKDWFRMIG